MLLLRYILILLLPVFAYWGLRRIAIRYGLNMRQFKMLLVLVAILLTVIILILLGRLPVHFIVAPVMVAITFLLRNLHLLIRLLPLVQHWRNRQTKTVYGSTGADEDTSSIRTRFLQMHLDHGTGAMEGEVLAGTFRGAALSSLNMEQLLKLADECRRDADSLQILEAYLDRVHPQWRADNADSSAQGTTQSASTGAESAMTETMALEILGLVSGAGREEIMQAHRRLMQKMHPDRGGSDYLAKKINAARDFLLEQ